MKRFFLIISILFSFLGMFAQDTIWLDAIDLSYGTSGWKKPIALKNIGENPLKISGINYSHGVGVHADSKILIDINKNTSRFFATCGIDDEQIPYKEIINPVIFLVVADGDTIWKSDTISAGDKSISIELDTKNYYVIQLAVISVGYDINGTYANWCNVGFIGKQKKYLTFSEYGSDFNLSKNEITKTENSTNYILTPNSPKKPRINSPKIYGVRPGNEFFYYIPVTGKRPIKYQALNLPIGLTLSQNGIIKGNLKDTGKYTITLIAENKYGKNQKDFKIIVSDKICLTPPMGWNSWNCFGPRINQALIWQMAKLIKSSGLADHGYSYVNIDDGWQGKRNPDTKAIQGNNLFPNIKLLFDSIHAIGLKTGIYSTPWTTSYMRMNGGSADDTLGNVYFMRRNFGVYSMHEQDAKQYASWGTDYLKYDWAGPDYPHAKAMSDALKNSGRDIVFSISGAININEANQFSKIANVYRTNGDIDDNWGSVYKRGFYHYRWNKFTKSGSYSDPDMLVAGWVGKGKGVHPSKLTADELYSHISLWALFSAPLILGCDLTKLDNFTLNLLTNDEVIAIDQDALVKPAELIKNDENGGWVFVKKLEDNSIAVGLFNTSSVVKRVSISWEELGIIGSKTIRDLWRQKNMTGYTDMYEAIVNPHGVVLIKIY